MFVIPKLVEIVPELNEQTTFNNRQRIIKGTTKNDSTLKLLKDVFIRTTVIINAIIKYINLYPLGKYVENNATSPENIALVWIKNVKNSPTSKALKFKPNIFLVLHKYLLLCFKSKLLQFCPKFK